MTDLSQTEIKKREFHLEEYKALRAEMIMQIEKYNQSKFILLTAIGAIYSWSFIKLAGTEKGNVCLSVDGLFLYAILSIPVLLSVIVSLNALYIITIIKKLGSYLLNLEIYLGEQTLGWEQYFSDRKPSDKNINFKLTDIFTTSDRIWLITIILCLLISYGLPIYFQENLLKCTSPSSSINSQIEFLYQNEMS